MRIVEKGNCERVAPAVCVRQWGIGLAARPILIVHVVHCVIAIPSLVPIVAAISARNEWGCQGTPQQ